MNLESKIESILLFRNEPISFEELSKILEVPVEDIKTSTNLLQEFYSKRGLVIINDGYKIAFGTNKNNSDLIEKLQKEENSRELGKAGLETLSIILYKGPVSRREIDYIRGVNSGFIIRNLLIRGLIEKNESAIGERSYSYKATLDLYRYLGITKSEELPEYNSAFEKLNKFATTIDEKDTEPEL